MKLLIIAGPYEADRIRKAAVSAGFETLAVEPGESLSGWINASRPDLIVMAPQIVHADPALALAKVRTTPRGRVPVFLVGDAADEERLRSLAEGFFVRPIAPDVLLAQARAILTPKRAQPDFERTEMGMGTSPPSKVRPPQLDLERTEMGLGNPMPVLKPLVAPVLRSAPLEAPRAAETGRLLAELNAGIDAILDAELQSAVAKAPKAPPKAPPLMPEFGGESTKKFDGALLADAARPPRKRPPRAAKTGETGRSTGSTSPGMPSAAPVQPGTPGGGPDPPATTEPGEAQLGQRDARARVLRRHALVQEGDYFAVLGVTPTATAEELQAAHAGVLSEISPPAVADGLARDLSAQIADVRAVADEALRVLGDPALRTRYASNIE
ncbi:MAG TPA: hypothetical protein VMT03_14740 [Polyangia bacterium]|nr:hypothetical protein [Polyangia bacterium]